MIEKSAKFPAAGRRGGLLDLNHTSNTCFSSVVQIAKFVRSVTQNVTNFAITTLDYTRCRWVTRLETGHCDRKGATM